MSAGMSAGFSITAGDLEPTGLAAGEHHQFQLSNTAFIYFTPEIAAQWIGVLEQIKEPNA